MIEIIMPKMGMHMTEGTIVAWLRPNGATVDAGEALLEVENDKVTNEVTTPVSGVLQILQPADTVCPVGAVLARIVESPATGALPSAEPAVVGGAAEKAAPNSSLPPMTGRWGEAPYKTPAAPPGVRATPLARRLARDRSVDLRDVAPSGPKARILERDVLAHLADESGAADIDNGYPPADARATAPATTDAITPTPMRRRIAERMMRSLHSTAQYTLHTWADVAALEATRAAFNGRWDKRGAPYRLTLTVLIVRGVALTLAEMPAVATVWDASGLRPPAGCHIGVAVALAEGLIVPVVRDADQLSIAALAERIQVLANGARDGTLAPDDVNGGTFSVSNLGPLGIDLFTPILNDGESGILGVGRIDERLILQDGQPVVQRRLPLSLTVDHRVVDGAVGAHFLAELVARLETPALLFAGSAADPG